MTDTPALPTSMRQLRTLVTEAGTVELSIETMPTPEPRPGQVLVRVDPRYFRPTEVDFLLGDPTRAKTVLGWEPRTRFPELVKAMVEADLQQAQRDQLCQTHGFVVPQPEE